MAYTRRTYVQTAETVRHENVRSVFSTQESNKDMVWGEKMNALVKTNRHYRRFTKAMIEFIKRYNPLQHFRLSNTLTYWRHIGLLT